MKARPRTCLAIDGHDGAGKSSIAKAVALHLGATVVKPFKDALGDYIAWLWRTEQFDLADVVARGAVEKAIGECDGVQPLVFDRHWLTMFTVLPESLHSNWLPLPTTVLCWADLPSTLARLVERGEEIGDTVGHERYLAIYRQLAAGYGVPIVETSRRSVEESASLVLDIVGLRELSSRWGK